MRRLLIIVTVCLCTQTAFAQELEPGDWPWFLGQNHTGVSAESDDNLKLDFAKNPPKVEWKKVVGTGYSAPSVRGDRLVLHHRIDDEELTQCMNPGTGAVLWTYKADSNFRDPYGYNNGPRCSPLLSDKHCYTLGAAGHLACVELATGKKVWDRDLLKDFKVPRAFFGVGCTPILEGNKLIVMVGGQPNAGVVAFDAASGKQLWASVGEKTWHGTPTSDGDAYQWTFEEQVVSYSSPLGATIHDHRHVLCLTRQGLVSLNPDNGHVRFKYWFRPGVHESVNAARPVVIGDRILLSAAYRLGSVLLAVSEDGNSVREVWKDSENLLAHWSTPIVADGFAYGFTGRHESEGELRCIDLRDGDVKWTFDGYDRTTRIAYDRARRVYAEVESGREVPRPLFGRGSKIRVGDHYIILGERGLVTTAKLTSEKYDEISRTQFKAIHYPAWTAPVLSRGKLYLRCEDALLCLDLTGQ